MKKKRKKIIGRREVVDFPELEIMGIEAKIDTGAYTSSIHCKDVKCFERDGKELVSFLLLDPSHPQYENEPYVWTVYERKQVKNSFGQTEERCVILTTIVIYNQSYEIELALADRSQMEYPVLLGRKAIRRRFLVDVSKTNLSLKSKLRKK
jgi:hypothetical protein